MSLTERLAHFAFAKLVVLNVYDITNTANERMNTSIIQLNKFTRDVVRAPSGGESGAVGKRGAGGEKSRVPAATPRG